MRESLVTTSYANKLSITRTISDLTLNSSQQSAHLNYLLKLNYMRIFYKKSIHLLKVDKGKSYYVFVKSFQTDTKHNKNTEK